MTARGAQDLGLCQPYCGRSLYRGSILKYGFIYISICIHLYTQAQRSRTTIGVGIPDLLHEKHMYGHSVFKNKRHKTISCRESQVQPQQRLRLTLNPCLRCKASIGLRRKDRATFPSIIHIPTEHHPKSMPHWRSFVGSPHALNAAP